MAYKRKTVRTNPRRKRLHPKKSKKLFSATASKTNYKNLMATPMRGGYRL